MDRRVRRLAKTQPDGQGVRLPLGGRYSLQRAAGRRAAVHFGGHGGDRRREEGTGGRSRRLSRKRTELDGTLGGLETARAEEAAQGGCRGRRVGLLGGGAKGVQRRQGATVHGAQDGQRAGQASQKRSGEGQGGPARNLPSSDSAGGRQGVRRLPREVPSEVSEGVGVLKDGSGGTAGLLRLPSRALEPFAEHQSDRIDVRDGAAATPQDEGERNPKGLFDDGVQTGAIGGAELASIERTTYAASLVHGEDIRRWSDAGKGRRLIPF